MILRILAIVLTALALVPAGAHIAALPNKIALPAEAYVVAQAVYLGWWLWGFIQIGAIFANGALALSLRHGDLAASRFALAAALLLVLVLAVFFLWTFPANQATANWTAMPDNWEDLRFQWEWSHALNAVLSLIALICSATAATSPRR